MLPQDLLREWFNLTKRDRLKPAGHFQAKRKTADAGKQI
jgi:hypothetical protein